MKCSESKSGSGGVAGKLSASRKRTDSNDEKRMANVLSW